MKLELPKDDLKILGLISDLRNFQRESNKIEGIFSTRNEEVDALYKFIQHKHLTIDNLVEYVSVVQPDAKLRTTKDMNVYVGNYVAPTGGMQILYSLENLLGEVNIGLITTYEAHVRYECIHPFTDGNGRSGRALWLWLMMRTKSKNRVPPLLFLHSFYYQALENYQQDVRSRD